MKTKEYMEKLHLAEFNTLYNPPAHGELLFIKNDDYEDVLCVDLTSFGKFTNDYSYWDELPLEDRRFLLDTTYMYVSTPVDERGEPKKYYLRHRYINTRRAYLMVNNNWECSLQVLENDFEKPTSEKTRFTKEEIEHIKKYKKTDLSDYWFVEVEE